MSLFVIWEMNGAPSEEVTLSVEYGSFGEEEGRHSIAIFYDTVRLEFGGNYEGGAGTEVLEESAVADAWVEYSYTYDPDEQLVDLKQARETVNELQAAVVREGDAIIDQRNQGVENPDTTAYQTALAAFEEAGDIFNAKYLQAFADGLRPQDYLDLEDYIAEYGRPDGFDSGTYQRFFGTTPSTNEFSGVGIDRFAEMVPSSFLPLFPGNDLFFDTPFNNYAHQSFWTVSTTATVHVVFDKSALEEFLEDGYVLEGGKEPSNSVLVVIENDGDWSNFSSPEVNSFNPAEIEGTIKVLDTFDDYETPEDPEITTYVNEVIIDRSFLEGMGIELAVDEADAILGFTTGEYLFSNDLSGAAPSEDDDWAITSTQATILTSGENRETFYQGVSQGITSGIFGILKTEVENLGLRAFSSYFTSTQDAADLAVSINTNLSDPLMRAIDTLDDEDPVEMELRFNDILDGIVQTVGEKFPVVASVLEQIVFSGRHSEYSYQIAFDPAGIPEGDSHSNRVVFGAKEATYHADSGDDYLFGGAGADTLYGEEGADVLSGGESDDMLLGGAGGDWIVGGAGDDTLIGGYDDDLLQGGGEGDLIILDGDELFSSGFAALNVSSDIQVGTQNRVNLEGLVRIEAVVDGGDGIDTVQLSEEGDAFFLHDAFSRFHQSVVLAQDYVGEQSAARIADIEEIRAMGGDDLIDLTSPDYSLAGLFLSIDGGLGDDIIWGSDADEFITGDDGADTIFGGVGFDFISGGPGADTFEFTRTSTDTTLVDFDIIGGDMLRFYNTGNAEFDASSVALISGGMFISYTDTETGISHDLAIAFEEIFEPFSATLPELMAAIEIV